MDDSKEAVRIKLTYRGLSIYTLVTFAGPDLYALQISYSGETINTEQGSLANIDALARMTTLALREYDADYVAANLLQCARGENTLPAIVADAILQAQQWRLAHGTPESGVEEF